MSRKIEQCLSCGSSHGGVVARSGLSQWLFRVFIAAGEFCIFVFAHESTKLAVGAAKHCHGEIQSKTGYVRGFVNPRERSRQHCPKKPARSGIWTSHWMSGMQLKFSFVDISRSVHDSSNASCFLLNFAVTVLPPCHEIEKREFW